MIEALRFTEGADFLAPDADLAEICEIIRKTQQPQGNTHRPMMANKYLSGSKLSKLNATDFFLAVIAEDAGFVDDVEKEYSFIGNELCDASFRAFPLGEINIRRPIPGTDWHVSIHPDRIIPRPVTRRIFFGEHKAHLNSLPSEKIHAAMRQPAIALAAAWRTVQENGGTYTFPIADYYQEELAKRGLPPAEPWTWPVGWTPGGIVSVIVRNKPPYMRIPRVLTEADLDQVYEYFIERKAKAIVEALTKNDIQIAHKFDVENSWEFGGETAKDIDELDDLIREYLDLKKVADEHTALAGGLAARIKPTMLKLGIKERTMDKKLVRVEVVKGRRTARVEDLEKAGPEFARFINMGAPYERLVTEDVDE